MKTKRHKSLVGCTLPPKGDIKIRANLGTEIRTRDSARTDGRGGRLHRYAIRATFPCLEIYVAITGYTDIKEHGRDGDDMECHVICHGKEEEISQYARQKTLAGMFYLFLQTCEILLPNYPSRKYFSMSIKKQPLYIGNIAEKERDKNKTQEW